MRLDDFDPDINVEDQRGSSGLGGFGGGGGGGGMLLGLLPLVMSRFGCGGVVVLLIVFAVFGGGLNLLGGGAGQRVAPSAQVGGPASGTDTKSSCTLDAASKAACNAFSSAENTWAAIFRQSGAQFVRPKLVFFGDQGGQSGCGAAQSAMGPFYCPSDQTIYLDPSFFDELQQKYGASGDFAQDYVIAHEFGHHIQNLLGTSDRVMNAQRQGSEAEGNALSVRLELQADCFAGVWAYHANQRKIVEPGDVEEALNAASAIGDDRLQEQGQGYVVPDSFTHGTSAQRVRWFKRGMESGDVNACDTLNAKSL